MEQRQGHQTLAVRSFFSPNARSGQAQGELDFSLHFQHRESGASLTRLKRAHIGDEHHCRADDEDDRTLASAAFLDNECHDCVPLPS